MSMHDPHTARTDFSARLPRGVLLGGMALVGAMIFGGLGAVQPVIAAALAIALGVALVVLRSPDTATAVVVFVLYSNIAVVAVHFHGVPMAAAAGFPLLLGVPLIRNLVLRQQHLIVTPVIPVLVAFLAVQATGMLFSRSPGIGKTVILQHVLEGLVLYLLVTNVVRTPKTLRLATWALLLAGLMMGALPTLQQITGAFDHNFGGLAQTGELGFRTGEISAHGEGRQIRMSGPIGEENRYAQVLLMLLPLGFFRFVDEKKRGLRLLALGCFICAGGGVLLAFSRGAIAALVVVFAMAVCMRVIRTRLLVIGSILGMIVLLAIPQVWTRLASVADISTMLSETHDRSVDSSIRGRVTEMIAAAQIFTDHPVIGVGPGMYKEYSLEYGNRLGIRKLDEARRAHSLYLEIAAENGLLGLLALLGVFFVTLSGLNVARKRCFHYHPEMANMATAYMLAVIAYMASALFLHMSYVRFIYLILALAAAATYVANRESMKVPVIERRST